MKTPAQAAAALRHLVAKRAARANKDPLRWLKADIKAKERERDILQYRYRTLHGQVATLKEKLVEQQLEIGQMPDVSLRPAEQTEMPVGSAATPGVSVKRG